mmetsp:Transcript_28507/g.63420  ORF Transcript_28507/g.63420 Transcript_28507/m.63420 type:complete len:92 (-) Transcript_28507:22-297(-)
MITPNAISTATPEKKPMNAAKFSFQPSAPTIAGKSSVPTVQSRTPAAKCCSAPAMVGETVVLRPAKVKSSMAAAGTEERVIPAMGDIGYCS